MGEYLFLLAMITFSLVNFYRKFRIRKQVEVLTEQNFKRLQNKKKEVRLITQEKVMSIFFLVWLGVGVAFVWIPDPTNFHFVKGVCIFIISNSIVELVTLSQKYRLYYNEEAFLYQGAIHKLSNIKAIGYSKIFFQPGKMHFKDGQSIILFKGGLDSIHHIISSKLLANKVVTK